MTKILKGSKNINGVNHNNNIVNIAIPNITIPKKISNIANKYKTNTVGDMVKLTNSINKEMQKSIDKASNYLQNREYNYNKEIRHIQGVLKRTKNESKIKAYNKRISELNKRIERIQKTRERKEQETKIKWEKIKAKVQLESALKNGENADRATLSNLLDVLDELDTQTNEINNPISSTIFLSVINYIFENFYNPSKNPVQTKLYQNCMRHANDNNLSSEEDYQNLKDELIHALLTVYNDYFAGRGYNTHTQFVTAVILKGFKNEDITNVI